MRSNTYILSKNREALANSLSRKIFINDKIDSSCTDAETLLHIARICPTDFFYIIDTDYDFDVKGFTFRFKPEEWDREFVHVWNESPVIKLYCRDSVLSNPEKYTNDEYLQGRLPLKVLPETIIFNPVYDVVFISFDEEHADQHYKDLKKKMPFAKRVHGVKGIVAAHQEAARLAETDLFYVVDADAVLSHDFEFNHRVHACDFNSVHVWKSKNPVNGLEYGYGGVKLFPRQPVLDYQGAPADFTTTVSGSLKVMDFVSNITCFNTDPFSAWRSGFRESVKLSAGLIRNPDPKTEERLEIWCTVSGNAEFGDFAVQGAIEGREFGREHSGNAKMLSLINDYQWLENKFTSG